MISVDEIAEVYIIATVGATSKSVLLLLYGHMLLIHKFIFLDVSFNCC